METQSKKILLALPQPLLRRLDAAAKRSERSRTAEVKVRLADSFKAERKGKAAA